MGHISIDVARDVAKEDLASTMGALQKEMDGRFHCQNVGPDQEFSDSLLGFNPLFRMGL